MDNSNLLLSISSIICSAITVSLFALLVRVNGQMLIPLFVFVMYALPIPIIYIAIKIKHTRLKRISQPILQCLRAISVVLSMVCFFYFAAQSTLVDAVSLLYTGPFFLTLFSGIFLKERLSLWMIIGIILGFVGVFLIVNVDKQVFQPMVAIGVLAGIFSAIGAALLRTISKTGSILQVNFEFYIFASITSILLMPILTSLFHGNIINFVRQDSIGRFVGSIIAFPFLSIINQSFKTIAFKKAQASLVSPFIYTALIFTAIGDWLLFGLAPTSSDLLGFMMIFIGILLTFWKKAMRG